MLKFLKQLVFIGKEINLIRLMLQDFHQAHFPYSEIYKNTVKYNKENYSKSYSDDDKFLDINLEKEYEDELADQRRKRGY